MWRGVLRLQALTALTVVALAAPRAGAAQFVTRVSWPLVDVLVRGDSTGRLEVLASPNLSTTQGRGPNTRLNRFSVAPVDALQWGTVMRRLVDSVDRLPVTPATILLRPPLPEIVDTVDLILLGAAVEAGKPGFASL